MKIFSFESRENSSLTACEREKVSQSIKWMLPSMRPRNENKNSWNRTSERDENIYNMLKICEKSDLCSCAGEHVDSLTEAFKNNIGNSDDESGCKSNWFNELYDEQLCRNRDKLSINISFVNINRSLSSIEFSRKKLFLAPKLQCMVKIKERWARKKFRQRWSWSSRADWLASQSHR